MHVAAALRLSDPELLVLLHSLSSSERREAGKPSFLPLYHYLLACGRAVRAAVQPGLSILV